MDIKAFKESLSKKLKQLDEARLDNVAYNPIIAKRADRAKNIAKGDVVGHELDLTKQLGPGRPTNALARAREIARRLAEAKELEQAAKRLSDLAKQEGLSLFEEVFDDADFVLQRAIKVENTLMTFIESHTRDLGIDEEALITAVNAAEQIDEAAKEAFLALLQTTRKISTVSPSIRAKIQSAMDLVESAIPVTKITKQDVSTTVKTANKVMADFAKLYADNYHLIAANLEIHEVKGFYDENGKPITHVSQAELDALDATELAKAEDPDYN